MNGSVRLRPGVLDEIVAHARAEAPNECCGLLVGSSDAIDEAVRVTNVEPGPARYRVNPVEHIRLNKRLRETPRAVVGAYHSHPRSSAEPSASDIAEAFDPDFLYVIVSLARPEAPDCRGWRIRCNRGVEVALIPAVA